MSGVRLPSLPEIDPQDIEDIESCPRCGTREQSEFAIENGFAYMECKPCGLVYLKKRLKPSKVGILYADGTYASHRRKSAELWRARRRVALLGSLPENARVHEDASSTGAFVFAARERGYIATGSDAGEYAPRAAREMFGVDVKCCLLEDFRLEDSSLDAFASFNLLSHLYSPWEYLREAHRVLRVGGLILMRVGLITSFSRLIAPRPLGAPEHVYHYRPRLIRQLVKEAGFSNVRTQPAFDSDFPYFLFDQSRTVSGIMGKVVRLLCSGTTLAWTLCRLPRDDVYIQAEKTQ